MSTHEFELCEPPVEPRARELWLQHAAGFILFEDARGYAREQIDASLSPEARAAAEKGIDDALYGLMTIIDGMTGGLSNARYCVSLDVVVRLTSRDETETVAEPAAVRLSEGDGMCMGFHGWREGDFGKHPVAVPRSATEK